MRPTMAARQSRPTRILRAQISTKGIGSGDSPAIVHEGHARPRLSNPHLAHRTWLDLPSSRCNFLPLLWERAGVRADVSVRLTSTPRSIEGAESGVLGLASRTLRKPNVECKDATAMGIATRMRTR